MAPQTYLVVVLILTVLLDLGLIFWTRRNLEKRGIDAEDEHAVFLFSSYSPVLTWLRYARQSIGDLRKKSFRLPRLFFNPERGIRLADGAYKSSFHRKRTPGKSRIPTGGSARVHLRFQLSPNERIQITVESSSMGLAGGVLVAGDDRSLESVILVHVESIAPGGLKTGSIFSDIGDKKTSKKINELLLKFRIFTARWLIAEWVMVLLAAVPVVLVVMDRWLKKPVAIPGVNELWYRLVSSKGILFPAYFLITLLSVIVIFVLLVLRKKDVVEINHQDLPLENNPQDVESNVHNLRWSKFLLLGSGISLVLALFAHIRWNTVVGWWFLLAVVMYAGGWLVRDISIQNMFDRLKENGAVILSYAAFYLSLLYFLASIYLKWNNPWVFLLVAVLTFANLMRYRTRIHPILWLVPIFLVLYTYRINGWEFSVIGDEYGFYEYARELAMQRDLGYIGSHLFDGQAVFGSHPFFSSFLQAIPMKLFGVSNFAWRLSSLAFVSASIPLFYVFFRAYTSQFIAAAASIFIGASHYLMTFGKIGYNNLQALLVMALVLSASAWAVKTRRRIYYVILGWSLGLCFYVYPAALYVLAVWLIFMLFYDPPNTREAGRNWLVMGGMFLILALPFLVQPGHWKTLIAGTLFYNPALLENISTTSKHVVINLLYSFFSFLYLPEEVHFVTVSYVDPLTAFLTLLGFLFSLRWVRKDRFLAYMCISFGVLVLLVGASHDRRFPPTTRMFMLLPWFAFFASTGLRWLYNQITRIRARPLDAKGFLAAVFLAVIMLNLYQAYAISKQRTSRYQSAEMLFLRLVQIMQAGPEVSNSPSRFLFLTDGKWDIDGYRRMQEVYDIPDSFMELDRYAVVESDWPQTVVDTVQDQNTLVVVYANLNQGLLTDIASNLSALHKESCPVAALDGSIRFYLWHSPQMQWVCEGV